MSLSIDSASTKLPDSFISNLVKTVILWQNKLIQMKKIYRSFIV